MNAKPDLEIISTKTGKQNAALIYIASLPSETTRRAQLSALEQIARKLGATAYSFDWGSLRYEHLVVIQTWLTKIHTPGTAKRYIAAIRGTLKAAWRSQEIDGETYQRAVDIPTIRGETITGRMLTMDEIAALLNTCSKGPRVRSTRDAAIISLMAGCGLRLNEVTGLDLANLDRDTGEIRLTGKGRKVRRAYLTGGVKEAMNEWLLLRGNEPGPIFYTIYKADVFFRPKRMSGLSVYRMIADRGEEAGLKHFSCHDLRRTFISHMLDLTDLATASKLAGHSNPMTTAKYDRRPEQRTSEAAALFKIPFQARRDV